MERRRVRSEQAGRGQRARHGRRAGDQRRRRVESGPVHPAVPRPRAGDRHHKQPGDGGGEQGPEEMVGIEACRLLPCPAASRASKLSCRVKPARPAAASSSTAPSRRAGRLASQRRTDGHRGRAAPAFAPLIPAAPRTDAPAPPAGRPERSGNRGSRVPARPPSRSCSRDRRRPSRSSRSRPRPPAGNRGRAGSGRGCARRSARYSCWRYNGGWRRSRR